eukprot:CAMPEP_0184521992 /NCGR_PEP_ID=MMETSP0198_2-20121128/8025_1 /TAXON_ID=1112570 /ORGANISM="Thraustochytrium sp., Strain LLF1b" /LENGTH=297 /DNA_ID=CAMNT_0026912751 /DNA_START=998 /DNA_END=1891 /DNA_ORIENTATION=+
MWGYFVALLVVVAAQYLAVGLLRGLDNGSKDSSLLPKLVILFGVLGFITLSHPPPVQPFLVQGAQVYPEMGLFVASVFFTATSATLMVTLQEPSLALLPIFFSMYALGRTVTHSPYRPNVIAPELVATLYFAATLVFFSQDAGVNVLVDYLVPGFDASSGATGYLLDSNSALHSALGVALVVALSAYGYLSACKEFAKRHNSPTPDVAYLMTPRNNGLENMARFMTSIQDAVTGNGPNPLPLDRHGPLGHLIAEKQFKRNLSTRRTALEDQRQVAVEELALESRNFDKLAEAFRQGR